MYARTRARGTLTYKKNTAVWRCFLLVMQGESSGGFDTHPQMGVPERNRHRRRLARRYPRWVTKKRRPNWTSFFLTFLSFMMPYQSHRFG